jgi:mRNA interferase MazF
MKHHYQKGEILTINLGKPPKEVKGHEQGYNRPCVVVKSFNNLGLAVIIPCTTTEPRYSIFPIVKLLKGSGGLSSDSFALCHQIRTVSFDRIISKCGKLDNKDVLKIHSVLMDTLEL